MHIFKTSYTFDHPWEAVTCANWKKYPNELTTHVVAVDILRREVDENTGVLRTERLITCKQNVPRFVSALIGTTQTYVREVSTVDPQTKTLKMCSQNLTANNLLSVFETVVYSEDPTNPGKTLFEQHAAISAFFKWQRICNQLEEFSVKRFNENAELGKKAFDMVLQKLFGESTPALA